MITLNMRYSWVGLSIFGMWIFIAIIFSVNKDIDATFLYVMGTIVSVVLSIFGFRSSN